MKSVWVYYPQIHHYSATVYDGPEGVVYFGGKEPSRCDDVVFTVDTTLVDVDRQRLLVLEPAIVEPRLHDDDVLSRWGRVYTFGKSELPNVRRYRMGMPPLWPGLGALHIHPWESRHNAIACVTGNKYPGRRDRLELYAQAAEQAGLGFHVYGVPGFPAERWYRGAITGTAVHKRELLSWYRYCLALENTFDCGYYLTEKLLDGLVSGCFCFYEGGPVRSQYPELPWEWVQPPLTVGAVLPNAELHRQYLAELLRRLPQISAATSMTPIWRMILEETRT